MIYIARARREDVFLLVFFFVFLAIEGFSVGFVENYYVVGLWYTFAKTTRVFLKKRAKIEFGCHLALALFLFIFFRGFI